MLPKSCFRFSDVSRLYVYNLIDEGRLPCRKVRTHYHIRLDDLSKPKETAL